MTKFSISTTTAKVYSSPAEDSSLVSEFLHGEAVEADNTGQGFVYAKSMHDGYEGYVRASTLGPQQSGPNATAIRPFVQIYKAPDIKSGVTQLVPMGGRISLALENSNKNGFRETREGGWVFDPHISTEDAPLADYVKTVKTLLNGSYLWGGKTFQGIDCSGLLQLVLNLSGINCPRDTVDQKNSVGTQVTIGSASELLYGDIVFTDGHVAVHESGNLMHADGIDLMVIDETIERFMEKRSLSSVRDLLVRRLKPA